MLQEEALKLFDENICRIFPRRSLSGVPWVRRIAQILSPRRIRSGCDSVETVESTEPIHRPNKPGP